MASCVEGILVTKNFDVFSGFCRKCEVRPNNIRDWEACVDFEFPEFVGEWWKELQDRVDKWMVEEKRVVIESSTKRTEAAGWVALEEMGEWVREVGKGGWVMVLVWDFRDIPGSFVGRKKTLLGFGGGCEILALGTALPRAIRMQTVECTDDF